MSGNHKRKSGGAFYRDLGRAIRAARSAAGKSQDDIAGHLDVSFQQLQKYETGKNRIPVEHLVSLSAYLEVPLSQLVAPSASDIEFQSMAAQFSSKEFHALMEAWGVIKGRPMRAALLNLVRCMADLSR